MVIESSRPLALEASDMPVAGVNPRWDVRVGTLLVFFVLLIVLPAWGFATYVAARYAYSERQRSEAAGQAMARSAASAIDFRLKNIEAAMTTLGLSPALRSNNLAEFYTQAQAFAATQRLAIALVDRTGRQVLNTNAPFGTALPSAAEDVKAQKAIESGVVQQSRLFWGDVTGQWLTAIAIPVRRNGEAATYALVAGTSSATAWGEILGTFDLPKGWIMSIADEANIILARRPDPEPFIGQPVHPEAVGMLRDAEGGWGAGKTRDGQPVYIAYQRLKAAPWLVLVGVPSQDVDGYIRKELEPVVMGGLVILLGTMLGAWFLGRRFHEQLVAVAKAATMLRRGGHGLPPLPPSRIRELSELKSTIESAFDERSRNEAQLMGLIEDKNLLMQEAHHRVKNSLQLVRGILSLQSRSAQHPEAKGALSAAAARIVTVADVHQHLYQGSSTTSVNVNQYLRDLSRDLSRSLLDGTDARHISATAPDIMWPAEKVTALGLIMTELVTNAIKYGAGDVEVAFAVGEDTSSMLTVSDSGAGFPPGYEFGQGGGLGSKLITSLIRPEEGLVSIDRKSKKGRVTVAFFVNWRSDQSQA